MTDVSMAEKLSSPEWIGDMRERLESVRGRTRSLARDAIENQIDIQLELIEATTGLWEELPKVTRSVKSKKKTGDLIGGLEATKTVQHHTRTYSLGYHPNHGHNVIHSELMGSGSFARLVEIRSDRYAKRPFIPLLMGKVALEKDLGSSTYVGLEFNSHSPIEPHPLDIEFDHIYCMVNADISAGSLPTYESAEGLAEGLHAVAVRSQMKPGESDLPEPQLLI